ncbi:asparagine synthetase B [Halonotius terrestris]|uniref:Asparagine synthetase B n=1 Tax=Halonotius terrestris TaxID=2487750 RepID=A0A8J8P9U4_9EURY|nr:asparagine synthase-related protein [Halonotius terrestris]TQQ83668.1 asparagine synthetase B [Halonotius terrestris]
MSQPPQPPLRGADAAVVRNALAARDPLPGASGLGPAAMGGFGGRIGDRLVRDVLGRQPVYSEADAADPTADGAWAFAPSTLDNPVVVPPGGVRTADDDEQVLTLPKPPAADRDEAMTAVTDALSGALDVGDDNKKTTDDVAVAFSGGVDSTLVASGFPDAPLYVVGFEGCHDITAAREAAAGIDRTADLTVIELTHDDLINAVPRVAAATGRTNPMDVTIALPLLVVAERAAADGYDRLALGQGADELFGGYSKVVEPSEDHRVDSETVRGAVRETIDTLPGQLERDVCGLDAVGIEPVTPFLQDRVVDAALRLPGELLATPEARKIALREFARETVGLPESVAGADKKAVQYGTYVSRELDRLARQNGYKRRMDDHVGQYIRELCAD